MKSLDRMVPHRILVRPSVQVLRGRLAALSRIKRGTVGPGMPIVGEFVFDRDAGTWRGQLLAAIAALSRDAQRATDRMAWLLCAGFPPEAPDDVYALAVQAAPLVQLHLFEDAEELRRFAARYVPPASVQEAKGRVSPNALEVLAHPRDYAGALNRATAVRAAGHNFVKQIGGDARVLAVHAEAVGEVAPVARATGVRLLVLDQPQAGPREAGCFVARHMGFTLLDELAHLRVCDGYVGPANHYAIAAADAGVPCLLSQAGAAAISDDSRIAFSCSVATDLAPWLARGLA